MPELPRIDPADARITNDTLLLRPYRTDDADSLYEAATESISAIHPWMPWCHPNYQRSESVAWIAHTLEAWGREFNFAICTPDGRLVGGCGLNLIVVEYMMANLGYWVRSSAHHQGLASSATRLLARWGIETLGLRRVEIVAAIGNEPSQRTALRAGAHREAVLRNRLDAGDAVMFSIIPADL